MADVKPIPDGYPAVIPYLHVDGAAEAIEFYTRVFGARERMRMGAPGDRVGHAELEIGDGLLMLADEFPDLGIRGPKTVGGTPVTISLYVEDVDDVYEKAKAEGAEGTRDPEDQFYGDRSGQFIDPWGHRWSVSTHIEDISSEEMERRAAQAGG